MEAYPYRSRLSQTR